MYNLLSNLAKNHAPKSPTIGMYLRGYVIIRYILFMNRDSISREMNCPELQNTNHYHFLKETALEVYCSPCELNRI